MDVIKSARLTIIGNSFLLFLCFRLAAQCRLQYRMHILGGNDGHRFADILRHILQILNVLLGNQHGVYARACAASSFSFKPPMAARARAA